MPGETDGHALGHLSGVNVALESRMARGAALRQLAAHLNTRSLIIGEAGPRCQVMDGSLGLQKVLGQLLIGRRDGLPQRSAFKRHRAVLPEPAEGTVNPCTIRSAA